ncbi:UDP-N-acetylmuramoyl-L-alanyl-D-glutamate--2,6-diaminopimelate ligase [Nitrincola sp.]|uniref:UDP-N-acetylmuramoyl-L-alanyl-D-glutamate--2, 6-diaminopimelate ligase n=1 Tax=Nitrincola sp. TaxID=1926584 RepID=UPI003A8D18D0
MNAVRSDLPSLKSLLPDFPGVPDYLLIRNVVLDNRDVRAGDLYIARSGTQYKGVDFVIPAISAGASAVIMHASEYHSGLDAYADWIFPVDNLNQVAGEVISRYYQRPSEAIKVIGITGTNGKTSCSHFIAQALNQLGEKTAIVGTIGNGFLSSLDRSTHTTPDVLSVHQLLSGYHQAGAETVVMEVSSHALDQARTAGVQFRQVGFTNLTRDHLDYHQSMAAYADSKRRLFEQAGSQQILNLDDAFGCELAEQSKAKGHKVTTYSLLDQSADLWVKTSELHDEGMSFAVASPWGEISASSSLIGRFNLSNLLLTAASLGLSGYEASRISRALTQVSAVCGRMEKVSLAGEPLVLVDYAHTPDALLQTLSALNEHRKTASRIICVFGCGGDRDQGKRPLMAQVACSLADQLIITSDNPRFEDPHKIIEQVLSGVSAVHQPQVEVDRATAIASAIAQARVEDIVLIAGKGHEDYQEVQGERQPFSDQTVARDVLKSRRTAC